MKKYHYIIGALAGLAALTGIILSSDSADIPKCPKTEIQLDISIGETKRLCLTKAEYSGLKKDLLDEYNDKSKAYDWDINHLPVLYAVLDREAKERKVSLYYLNKETMKKELINFLTP